MISQSIFGIPQIFGCIPKSFKGCQAHTERVEHASRSVLHCTGAYSSRCARSVRGCASNGVFEHLASWIADALSAGSLMLAIAATTVTITAAEKFICRTTTTTARIVTIVSDTADPATAQGCCFAHACCSALPFVIAQMLPLCRCREHTI